MKISERKTLETTGSDSGSETIDFEPPKARSPSWNTLVADEKILTFLPDESDDESLNPFKPKVPTASKKGSDGGEEK